MVVNLRDLAKDRARPFSKKHRRYWIPVLGSMIGIGIVDILVGYGSYHPPQEPERIKLVIPPPNTPASAKVLPDGSTETPIGNGEIPGDVIRAFTTQFPRTVPRDAIRRQKGTATTYLMSAGAQRVEYKPDGTLL